MCVCTAHLLVLEGRLPALPQVCVAQSERIRVRSSADSRAAQAVRGDGGTDEIDLEGQTRSVSLGSVFFLLPRVPDDRLLNGLHVCLPPTPRSFRGLHSGSCEPSCRETCQRLRLGLLKGGDQSQLMVSELLSAQIQSGESLIPLQL